MKFRHLVRPLLAAAVVLLPGALLAQGAFGPPPGQASGSSPFPSVNGAAPSAVIGAPAAFPSQGAAPIAGSGGGGGGFGPPPQGGPGGAAEDCSKGFLPLRQETERRGLAIKAASERRAPAEEACKLIGNFSQAELKMIRYVEQNSKKCGIPPQVAEQFKNGHKNTDAMQKKVCAAAQQANRGPAGPSLSDVLGSSSALPEAAPTKRTGGSTFDTLSGNVLTR